LIDKQLRDDLLPSVGMRNVLVHEYLEIDLRKVLLLPPFAGAVKKYKPARTLGASQLELLGHPG
jgi:uncharacterized protein YutE (UPF0331/DUF86 family)